MVGCTTTTTVIPTYTDKPTISSRDAIAIAQQHSVNEPLNTVEGIIGNSVKMNITSGWTAQYNGNGKWTITYLTNHWSVFENTNTAVFLGKQ